MVISWWSYSTPLWYGRWVEGARPDMTIIDDRTMLDDHLGSPGCDGLGEADRCMMDVIDGYLGRAPGLPHPPRRVTCPSFASAYRLEPVPGIPHGRVWRVVGTASDAAP